MPHIVLEHHVDRHVDGYVLCHTTDGYDSYQRGTKAAGLSGAVTMRAIHRIHLCRPQLFTKCIAAVPLECARSMH